MNNLGARNLYKEILLLSDNNFIDNDRAVTVPTAW